MLIVLACLVLAAAIGAGVWYFLSNKEEEEEESIAEYVEKEESSLPVLSMEYEGRMINMLYAYSAEMELEYAAESLYLLEDSYEVPIEIDLKGNSVSSLGFYLYDTESGTLIQNSTVKETETEDGTLSAVLEMDEVISNDIEYVLDIVLDLKSGEELHYYTRLLRTSGLYVADQIDLAFSFTNATLSGDEDLLSNYMNVNPWTQTNTNFSGVNLQSSVDQMMWQNMDVELYGEASLTILDIYGYIGCYEIDYMVTRQNGDTTEYYQISEYYRIRMNSDYTNILSYERSVDQVFIPADDLLGSSSIELGIISSEDEDIETAVSDDGNYNCFVYCGSLWCVDSSSKAITEVFSFDPEEVSELNSLYRDHDIEVLSVSDTGDIVFLLYGYMNSGLHEGLSGIALYSYSASDGEVTELLFIQTDVSYEILKETAGEMVYLSDNNSLYILIDEYLYSISLDTLEMETVAEGLSEGSFEVSLDGNVIAWQEEGKVNDADTIVLFNAQTEQRAEVSADWGCYIKILGFIGDDLVYGQGSSSNDFYYDENDEEYLLMDTVYVLSSSGVQQSEDVSESGYFISAEYEYNRIIITKNTGEEYTLFSSEITDKETPSLYSDYDDTREYIYYVELVESTTTSGDYEINTQTAAYLTDSCLINVTGMLDLEGEYLVWGKGHLQLITSSASEAVIEAYEAEGCVKISGGGYFYRRGLIPTSVTFTENNISSSISSYNEGAVINITGISLVEAEYFIGESLAVFWVLDGNTYLVYGYNSEGDLRLYNIATDETSLMDEDEAEETFETAGSVYVLE